MISIIIVNFKQKKFTEECVNSLFQNLSSGDFEIIIIDNSPVPELELTANKKLQIITAENKGFGAACNEGARYAKGAFLLFLNADTIVISDFLNDLFVNIRNLEFGAIGLKLVNPDGTPQLSFWKENTFFNETWNKKQERLFAERNPSALGEYNDIKSIMPVDWVSGASMLIKKSLFESIGGFDESFFLFYEDADLCKRLSLRGCTNYYYPFSDILHYKGENVNKAFQSSTYYYAKESQLKYYNKHNSPSNRVILRAYLFFKFLYKWLTGCKPLDKKILLLVLGARK